MRHGGEPSGDAAMTFREKHLWISIVSTVLVWGFYYVRLIQGVLEGALSDPRFGWMLGALFIGCLVTSVVIEIVLTILASLTTRKAEREARDEREMLASLKASHVSLMALIAIVFSLSICAYLLGLAASAGEGPGVALTDGAGLVLVSNALMAAVIASELIRYVFTLALLRRGR
jgi:hypothetical protein